MTLSLSKSTWSARERLASADLNAAMAELLKAGDFTNGGTYSPADVIEIGGTEGLVINGSGSGARLRYSSRAISRVRPFLSYAYTTSVWQLTGGSVAYWEQYAVTGAGVLVSTLDGLPNGATLDTVAMSLKGAAGHGGAPGTAVTLRVYRRPYNSATSTQLGSTATDPYTSAGVYEAEHTLSVSTISHTIDTTLNQYYVQATGEDGANKIAGLQIHGLLVTCTLTDQPEWF